VLVRGGDGWYEQSIYPVQPGLDAAGRWFFSSFRGALCTADEGDDPTSGVHALSCGVAAQREPEGRPVAGSVRGRTRQSTGGRKPV
jgi:hypothetical protein